MHELQNKKHEEQKQLQENQTNEEDESDKDEISTPEETNVVEEEVEQTKYQENEQDESEQQEVDNPPDEEPVQEEGKETDTSEENSTNLCKQATNCNQCLLQDTIVSDQGYSCEWKQVYDNTFQCQMVSTVVTENGVQKLFTCDEDGSSSNMSIGEDGGLLKDNSTTLGIVVALLAFIGIGIRLKSKKDKVSSSPAKNTSYTSNNKFRKNNSNAIRFRQTETVPLTIANNEEEWGWEDDTAPNRIEETTTIKPYKDVEIKSYKDVEMVQQKSLKNDTSSSHDDDDELQKAIALSLETNTTPSPIVSNTMNPIITRNSSVGSNSSNSNKNKTISTIKPKKKANPTSDDIFASVGITAKPTFSNASNTKVAPVVKNTTQATSLSALTQQNEYDDEDITDWGDDDDLDDLLA